MSAITIRNIPEKIRDGLKVRARENHRSTEAEIRAILADAVSEPRIGLGTALHLLGRKYHDAELDTKLPNDDISAPIFP